MAVDLEEPGFSLREQEEIKARIEAAHRKKREQREQQNLVLRTRRKKRRIVMEQAKESRKTRSTARKQELKTFSDEVNEISNITPISLEEMHAMLAAIGVMELLD